MKGKSDTTLRDVPTPKHRYFELRTSRAVLLILPASDDTATRERERIFVGKHGLMENASLVGGRTAAVRIEWLEGGKSVNTNRAVGCGGDRASAVVGCTLTL